MTGTVAYIRHEDDGDIHVNLRLPPNEAGLLNHANLAGDLTEHGRSFRFLIRDRDTKFTTSFDEVFKTPIRSPRANATAERWVRTIREECLDWTLVLGRHHLEAVLRDYVRHYNQHRPHRGLRLQVPAPLSEVTSAPLSLSDIGRRDVLGRIIHEYHAAA